MALPNPGWNVVYGEIPAASKWSQLGVNDDALAAGTGLNDRAVTGIKMALATVKDENMDFSTFRVQMARHIPFDATKTGAVTIIDTGLYFGTKKVKIAYRCWDATMSTPATYSLLQAVNFTSVFNAGNVANITDVYIMGRYRPSNDIMFAGSDVAGSQRMAGKMSASTFMAEVWGQFGGATSSYGVVAITYLE